MCPFEQKQTSKSFSPHKHLEIDPLYTQKNPSENTKCPQSQLWPQSYFINVEKFYYTRFLWVFLSVPAMSNKIGDICRGIYVHSFRQNTSRSVIFLVFCACGGHLVSVDGSCQILTLCSSKRFCDDFGVCLGVIILFEPIRSWRLKFWVTDRKVGLPLLGP